MTESGDGDLLSRFEAEIGGVGAVTADSLLGQTNGMDGGKWVVRKQVVDWRRLMTLE